MKTHGKGLVQLGDLRSEASWTAGKMMVTLRFSTESFSEEQWQEIRHLRNRPGRVFLLRDGTADREHHIIGYERDWYSVTFHLATPYSMETSKGQGAFSRAGG